MSVLASLQGTGQLTQVPWGLGLGRQGPRGILGRYGGPRADQLGLNVARKLFPDVTKLRSRHPQRVGSGSRLLHKAHLRTLPPVSSA